MHQRSLLLSVPSYLIAKSAQCCAAVSLHDHGTVIVSTEYHHLSRAHRSWHPVASTAKNRDHESQQRIQACGTAHGHCCALFA